MLTQIHDFTEANRGYGNKGHVKAVDPARTRAADVHVAQCANQMYQRQQRCAAPKPGKVCALRRGLHIEL
jgi:hypothetical protein